MTRGVAEVIGYRPIRRDEPCRAASNRYRLRIPISALAGGDFKAHYFRCNPLACSHSLSNISGKITNRVHQYHNNLWYNNLRVAGF